MASATAIIVPGACQPPSFYTSFAQALQGESIASVVIPNPSCGASPGLKDMSADVTLIRQTVTGLLDSGKDVILVMHSYGGIPGSAALEGLGKNERSAKGERGGVIRLVYVCSFALKEGEQQPGAGDIEQLRQNAKEGFDEEAGTVAISPAGAAFMAFHDLSKEEAEHWSSMMQPHSVGAMWDKQNYAAWKDIPSTYVVCTRDRVIPVEGQEGMIKMAKEVQPKAFDIVERLDSGHEPFLSKIEDLVIVVGKVAKSDGSW